MPNYIATLSAVGFALLVAATEMPAQSGAFAAPVQVVNGATSPVPIRDVDAAGRQRVSFSGTIADVGNELNNTLTYSIPAGKRLVIEQIYCSMFSSSSPTLLVDTQIGGKKFEMGFLPTASPSQPYQWYLDRQVKIFPDDGISAILFFVSSPGGGSARVAFWGYLEKI